MRPAAIAFIRFSNRRNPTPLTITLRKPTTVTYPPWRSVSKRLLHQDALRQNSSSGPETRRHPESAAQPCLPENEARCQCCQHRRVLNINQDQGNRSPFMDAFLTALMGLGIGELRFYAMHLFHIDSSTTLLPGHLIRVARVVVQNVMMHEDMRWSSLSYPFRCTRA
jgi:hypothetical protein